MSKSATFDIVSPGAKAAQVLRQEIREGRYSVGERLANERTLAERFNVSRGTIRKAMKMLETERLIARQQGRGTFVANPTFGPTPGSTQNALLGAIVSDKVDYFAALLRAASSQATLRGYVLTTGANVDPEEESQHVEVLMRSGTRGVLMTPRPFSLASYLRLREAHLPIVLVDARLPDIDEDFVSVDDRQGTFQATMHLIKLGHRRLAYVGHPHAYDIPCRPDRLGGFLDACSTAGIAVRDDFVVELDLAGSSEKVATLLSSPQRPTGVVAFNDDRAVIVANAARAIGLEIPKDISIVGFDNGPGARLYEVPLTSVDAECREIGIASANLLIDKIDNPRKRPTLSVRVMPRLVIRESCSKPPRA